MKEIDSAYPPMLASRDPKIAASRQAAINQLKQITNMTDADVGASTTPPIPSGVTVTQIGQ